VLPMGAVESYLRVARSYPFVRARASTCLATDRSSEIAAHSSSGAASSHQTP